MEHDGLRKIWSINTPCYRELLSEDIDGDGKQEIIALGNSLIAEKRREYGIFQQRKYFLDIYKENDRAEPNRRSPWLSTFQDSDNRIVDEEDGEAKGLLHGDFDGDGTKEIVFATSHHIVIFRYLQNKQTPNGRLVKIAALRPALPKERLRINAISILKEREENRIVVSVNVEVIENHVERGMHYAAINKLSRGYVLVYQFSKENKKWDMSILIPVEIDFLGTLKSANIDTTDDPEICIVGNKKKEDADNHFLYVLNKNISDWKSSRYPIGPFSFEPISIGLGQLDSITNNNEIVTLKPGIMQMDVFEWTKENGLMNRISKNLSNERTFSSSCKLAIADIDQDGINEIILAGFGRSGLEDGDLFLGIYDQNLKIKGRIFAGGQTEKRARAIAIIK